MEYKTIDSQWDTEEIEKLETPYQLICNGVLKRRSKDYHIIKPYWIKAYIAVRFLLYATNSILNDGERPYKALLKSRIDEDFEDYMERIKFKIYSDADEFKKRSMKPEEIYQKTLKNAQKLYVSDFQTAYRQLDGVFILIERRWSGSHKVHYIKLTNNGKKLMSLISAGYVF